MNGPLAWHPPMNSGWIDAPHRMLMLGDFFLEGGESISDCRLSYVIHGEMNRDRSNVILAQTAIGTSHHRLDFLIGPGRALDTDEYCVVVADALGNGLSSSPSNSATQPGRRFPRFTIRDMIESQRRLIQDEFGIARLAAIVGASMGGMQALQWAVSHPDAAARIVALTPMAKTAAWSVAINTAGRAALMADPLWDDARHVSSGLRAWLPIIRLISGQTPIALQRRYPDAQSIADWATAQYEGGGDAPIAIDWIWQSHAYDAHDLGTTPGFSGDTSRALASIVASCMIMSSPLDLYNPAFEAHRVASEIPGAIFREIPSDRGHQSANAGDETDVAWLNAQIGAFLAAGGN